MDATKAGQSDASKAVVRVARKACHSAEMKVLSTAALTVDTRVVLKAATSALLMVV